MGEAKRRGSFEERKEQALTAGRKKKNKAGRSGSVQNVMDSILGIKHADFNIGMARRSRRRKR